MLKKLIVASLTLILLAVGISAQEDVPDDWFMYLYDEAETSLIRVDADGETDTFALDLQSDSWAWRGLAFSSDGRRMAYCRTRQGVDAVDARAATLILRDIEAETDIINMPLVGVRDCITPLTAFNPDNSLVAITMIGPASFSQDVPPDADLPAWQIMVYDVETGELAYELNHESPIVADDRVIDDPEDPLGYAVMPQVIEFDEERIVFTSWYWQADIMPNSAAFIWHFTENRLEPTLPLGNASYNSLVLTGESLWLSLNQQLAASPSSNPYRSSKNLIMLHEADGTEKAIFYSPQNNIIRSRFSYDGTQVNIHTSTPRQYTDEGVTGNEDLYFVLNRDGSVEAADSSIFGNPAIVVQIRADYPDAQVLWWQDLANPQISEELVPFPALDLTTQPICGEGTMAGRLMPQQQARVISSNAANIQYDLNANSEIVGSIPGGDTFDVRGVAVCDDEGRAWWLVYYEGVRGWVLEGEGDTYYLEPVSG